MSFIIERYRLKMTENDKTFFAELGQQIAKLRKEQDMTQGQLAEYLSISQQHMASFEKGIRKVPASMLPMLAKLFAISVDELVGLKNPAAKRGIGIIPAFTQALCASNIDWASSESPAGSPPYGPSSEIGMTIFVALGFHL